jgi:RNA recognition motif-containing protein
MDLFVGNLKFDINDEELKPVFEEYGTVEKVRIIKDKETGRSRGFGFVTMPNEEEAQKAIEALDNADLEGRTLKVNKARPKQ